MVAYLQKETSVLSVERLKVIGRFDEKYFASVVTDGQSCTLFAGSKTGELLFAQLQREHWVTKCLKNIPDYKLSNRSRHVKDGVSCLVPTSTRWIFHHEAVAEEIYYTW